MDPRYVSLLVVSPFAVIIGYSLLIYRFFRRKEATVIKGRIVANVYRPFSQLAAASIEILEGPDRGKTFTSKSTVAMFGHAIGKEIKVYQFGDGDDYDYHVVSSYYRNPILLSVSFTLIILLGFWIY